MVKFYDDIPDFLIDWIPKQEIFWVATAPLSGEGHVNLSPKGLKGTFHVDSPTRVWYEDMTGSGSETIAHLRENGRITVMFNEFQGAPRISRLFGTGTVHEWGSPEYQRCIPAESRTPGSRSVIVIDVHKVSTSCGYAVPYFAFQGHRTLLTNWSASLEKRDVEFARTHPDASAGEFAENGLKAYWKKYSHSIDGLPSVQCYTNRQPIVHSTAAMDTQKVGDAPGKQPHRGEGTMKALVSSGPALVMGFTAGLATAALTVRYMEIFTHVCHL